MALTRRIARPLLASIFIAGGLDAVRHPGSKAKAAEAVTGPLSEQVAVIPADPELLVRVNGAVQIGAGVLLAVGRFRRLASLALIGSIIPTTYAGHRFWEETDDAARAQQRIHFLKNLGLLGGLVLAAVDTEGEPSLGWRAKRRAHQMETAVAVGRAVGSAKTGSAATKAALVASKAPEVGRTTARKGRVTAGRAVRRANKLGVDSARNVASTGSAVAQLVNSSGMDGFRHAQDVASDVVRRSGASDVVRRSGELASQVAQQANSSASQAARQLKPVLQSAVH